MTTSWKAEVIADASGKWCGNALRFKTKAEAETYASDLYGRWTAVREKRVKHCNDAPTHVWDNDTWSAQGLPWPKPESVSDLAARDDEIGADTRAALAKSGAS